MDLDGVRFSCTPENVFKLDWSFWLTHTLIFVATITHQRHKATKASNQVGFYFSKYQPHLTVFGKCMIWGAYKGGGLKSPILGIVTCLTNTDKTLDFDLVLIHICVPALLQSFCCHVTAVQKANSPET